MLDLKVKEFIRTFEFHVNTSKNLVPPLQSVLKILLKFHKISIHKIQLIKFPKYSTKLSLLPLDEIFGYLKHTSDFPITLKQKSATTSKSLKKFE